MLREEGEGGGRRGEGEGREEGRGRRGRGEGERMYEVGNYYSSNHGTGSWVSHLICSKSLSWLSTSCLRAVVITSMELCWREEEGEGRREKRGRGGEEEGEGRREKRGRGGEEEGEGRREKGRKERGESKCKCKGREQGRAYHGILSLILMVQFMFGKELKLMD